MKKKSGGERAARKTTKYLGRFRPSAIVEGIPAALAAQQPRRPAGCTSGLALQVIDSQAIVRPLR